MAAAGRISTLGRPRAMGRSMIQAQFRKCRPGESDVDAVEADLMPDHEARIAASERLVGRQTLKIGPPMRDRRG